ncbi:cupin domain-containing protein [Terriglobus aquaticus]|uniref:Cupin domain-containing protein n=1 Tax=Terriglobus aquaticus TaxID=940139 RepID=A0ABW9KMW3_9BACT|nr:cupin domain-containing protein [Terriglobus aquaticus]
MADETIFDIAELAATLPATSETMLRDLRLVDREAASCRIFRTYRPVPLHFHVSCDEYLYVLQGRAMFQIGDAEPREVGPGMLIYFPKRTVHGMPALLEEPFVVLAIDTPRRPIDDVTFVDPADGDAKTFIATNALERIYG